MPLQLLHRNLLLLDLLHHPRLTSMESKSFHSTENNTFLAAYDGAYIQAYTCNSPV